MSDLPRVYLLATVERTIEMFLRPHEEQLTNRGYEVHECTNFLDCPDNDFRNTSEVHCNQVPFSRKLIRIDCHVLSFLKLLVLFANAPAGSFVHASTPIASVLGRLAARLTDLPVLYIAHGFHTTSRHGLNPWLLIERLLRRLTTALVVVNQQDYEWAVTNCGYSRESVFLMPGVGRKPPDVVAIRSRQDLMSEPDREATILVVGHLECNKRPQLALASFAAVERPNCRLKFCGDGPLSSILMDQASELGVSSRVDFQGWVADMSPHYSSAAVLLFLSEREGLPMSVLESMGYGMPIVAFPIRGVLDLLSELPNWIIPQDIDTFHVAEALDRALALPPVDWDSVARAKLFSVEQSLAVHDQAVSAIELNNPTRSGQVAARIA